MQLDPHHRATMETQYEDEKAISVGEDIIHNPQTTAGTQSWMKTTTNFLATWGIETNG